MKKIPFLIGLGLLATGFGILVSIFLPDSILICIQAILLIVAGFLIINSK